MLSHEVSAVRGQGQTGTGCRRRGPDEVGDGWVDAWASDLQPRRSQQDGEYASAGSRPKRAARSAHHQPTSSAAHHLSLVLLGLGYLALTLNVGSTPDPHIGAGLAASWLIALGSPWGWPLLAPGVADGSSSFVRGRQPPHCSTWACTCCSAGADNTRNRGRHEPSTRPTLSRRRIGLRRERLL